MLADEFRRTFKTHLVVDMEQYKITINGVAVIVESEAYNESTHTVILSLPEGAVQQVVVG